MNFSFCTRGSVSVKFYLSRRDCLVINVLVCQTEMSGVQIPARVEMCVEISTPLAPIANSASMSTLTALLLTVEPVLAANNYYDFERRQIHGEMLLLRLSIPLLIKLLMNNLNFNMRCIMPLLVEIHVGNCIVFVT